jgi:AcrR family transcriptional regulator
MATNERHSPPRRTRMPAAQRRETILAAAAGVFAEAGYRAAKVSDIAARVGVSEPVVFQNFGSKSALFAAVLERAAGQVRESAEEAAARFGSAAGLLAHVLGDRSPGPGQPGQAQAHEGHGDPHATSGMLFADAVALAADPAASEISGQALRTLAGHLADIVRQGQQDESVRADIPPEPTAWLLISLLAARPLRDAAMPAGLEPTVAGLAARMLSSSPASLCLARAADGREPAQP